MSFGIERYQLLILSEHSNIPHRIISFSSKEMSDMEYAVEATLTALESTPTADTEEVMQYRALYAKLFDATDYTIGIRETNE